ncbi:MAG: class I SAM-dependent methyltransferase [Nitrospirae bacterium]|nr:class I SAM-dependent methyltransferase [Nitrospirota bacterium]
MVHINPAAYDEWYRTPFGSVCHRLERDALFSLADFRDGDRVLDAGCGTGVYMRELNGMGLNPVGVDADEGMLNYAASSCGRWALLAGARAEALPFKDASFDRVVSVCTLEFVAAPETAVREMARMLKQGGILLVGFLNGNSTWAELRLEKAKDPSSVWHGVRFYTLAEITGLAGKCGLRPRGFRSAVHFLPGSEGMSIDALEALEEKSRLDTPSAAAFIAAAFRNSG